MRDALIAPRASHTVSSWSQPTSACVECVIIESYTALAKAVADPDSMASRPVLATATVSGHAGDSVMVQLTADDSLLQALPQVEALTIQGAQTKSVSLRALTTPRVLYRFVHDDTVTLHLGAFSSQKLKTGSNGRIRLYEEGMLVYVAEVPPGCA